MHWVRGKLKIEGDVGTVPLRPREMLKESSLENTRRKSGYILVASTNIFRRQQTHALFKGTLRTVEPFLKFPCLGVNRQGWPLQRSVGGGERGEYNYRGGLSPNMPKMAWSGGSNRELVPCPIWWRKRIAVPASPMEISTICLEKRAGTQRSLQRKGTSTEAGSRSCLKDWT